MTTLTRYGMLKVLEKLQYPDLAKFLRHVYGDATAYKTLALNLMIERPEGPHSMQIADLRLIEPLVIKHGKGQTVVRSLEYFELVLTAIPISERIEINRSIVHLDRKKLLA